MADQNCRQGRITSGWVSVLTFLLLGLLLSGLVSTPAQADFSTQGTESYCLSCHANPDLSMTLSSGEVVSLYVSPEKLNDSTHSQLGIECQACHTAIETYPHPQTAFQTRRELSQSYVQACQKCHSTIFDKAQDSIHAQVSAEHPEAPICSDCHGAHSIQAPNEPRSRISATCSHCHAEIYDQYKASIHGSALINEDNPDVPVCTDCHGVHNIQDPRTEQFRIDSPEMCAHCHADPELMAKYGLSADVYDLYELSWHGVDVSVYKARWPTIWHDSAVCTDCHGVHNIRTTDDPLSSVHPDNLLVTCQNCHPGVSANWTQAWTGHNEISRERTPLLYYLHTFYTSFIPSVLWAAAIYVFLQILRAIVNRVKRNLQ